LIYFSLAWRVEIQGFILKANSDKKGFRKKAFFTFRRRFGKRNFFDVTGSPSRMLKTGWKWFVLANQFIYFVG